MGKEKIILTGDRPTGRLHIVSLGCGLLTLVLVFGVCMHSEVAAAETLSLRSFMVPNFWFQTEAAAESSSGINWAIRYASQCDPR